jgi:predicted ATP-binding protein involved in virulence
MEISRLKILNFRNIGDAQIFTFNPKFTVVIGVNGKGKSTLLHATRIACGAYLLGIPGAPKRHIYESEIRRVDFESHLAAVTPTIIEATGKLDNVPLKKPWRRKVPKEGQRTTSNYVDVGEIKSIAAKKYELINELGQIDVENPVIAYFGTERLHGNAKNTIARYHGREVFKYGYYSCLDMKFGSYQYTGWLQSFPYLVSDGKEKEETRSAFFEALKLANPYIEEIDFDGSELRIRTRLEDQVSQYLPLSLHSDGVITHTAMVAELAFRCLVLNSHFGSEAIKKSNGVVMIDEIDLHIHPRWQRHIVADLKNAFPNIQFVVTTHSPFIVQSLRADELINLDKETDIDPTDLSIEEVVEDVMGVSSDLSIENEASANLAENYLETLNVTNLTESDQSTLEEIESKISDPGLRAFLKMNRLQKGYESGK